MTSQSKLVGEGNFTHYTLFNSSDLQEAVNSVIDRTDFEIEDIIITGDSRMCGIEVRKLDEKDR